MAHNGDAGGSTSGSNRPSEEATEAKIDLAEVPPSIIPPRAPRKPGMPKLQLPSRRYMTMSEKGGGREGVSE